MAGRAPKILIVEDDRPIRLLLRNTMTRVGYQMVWSCSTWGFPTATG